MFGLITGLSQSSFDNIPSGNSDEIKIQKKTALNKRLEILNLHFKSLVEKSGKADLNESLNVTYSNSLNADSAEVEFNIFSQNQLNIPLIYLFDFKKDFNVNNLDELNFLMKDPEWLQKFLNKISDALGVPQISANEKILDSLREEMCWIKNNPEKAADGCRFVILHEFGHINDPNLSRGKQIGTAIAIVLAGLTSTVLVFTISVFLVEASTMALGIILTSGAAAASLVVIVVTGVTISIIAMKILQIKVGRRREIFADNFAAGVLKGDEGKKIRQGGIYFFQKDRSEIGLYQKLTDLHPTPRERIRMLENYIEESS